MRIWRNGKVNPPTWEERFWAKVDKAGECWEWTGYKTAQGYGRYQAYWPEGKQNTMAHRFAYEQTHGIRLDSASEIDHMCFNKSCVNPDHLRVATSKQNKENHSGPQSNSTSGVRGVYRNKEGTKWQAVVTHHKKVHYLGVFDTIPEAEAVVVAKRLELFTYNIIDRLAS